MTRVMIHPLAGVLSAYGMGRADMTELRQRTFGRRLEEATGLTSLLDELAEDGSAALLGQGVSAEAIEIQRRAALRYDGSDSTLEVEVSEPQRMRAEFETLHRARFGFVAEETPLVIETAIAEAVGKTVDSSSPATAGVQTSASAGRSEEHTSELQSLMRISYAVFC